MDEQFQHSSEATGLASHLNVCKSQMESLDDSPTYNDPLELPDDELVLAIIHGKAPYTKLLRRAPNRTIAARFYAIEASKAFGTAWDESECELCGMSGSEVTFNWSATVMHLGANFVEALILLPIVFLTIILGGIFSTEKKPSSDQVTFQTRHTLCRHCRPGVLRRLGVGIFRGVICLLSLAMLAILIFSGAVLISWMAGVLEDSKELAIWSLPLFVLSSAFMLSFLTRWPRAIEKNLSLPVGLRGFARGPFGLDTGSSFHLT